MYTRQRLILYKDGLQIKRLYSRIFLTFTTGFIYLALQHCLMAKKLSRLDKLLKELKEMPEEEARQIARDHLRRYKERLERKRAEKDL